MHPDPEIGDEGQDGIDDRIVHRYKCTYATVRVSTE